MQTKPRRSIEVRSEKKKKKKYIFFSAFPKRNGRIFCAKVIVLS